MTELFQNIRGLYKFKAPSEELKNYIEFFSESNHEATKQIVNGRAFSIKMFQSWTPTFWINLGPSYNLVMGGTVRQIKAHSAIAVTRAVTAERLNHFSDHLFTVKFYPGALNTLLGVDQAKIHSGLAELTELLPYSLVQQIISAGCFEQRISLTEQYLLQKIRVKTSNDHYSTLVMQTIGFYNENGLKFNVNELASKAFTSSKTITRYFERVIGISPKQYLESVKVRTALPLFLADRKNFDPTEFGYYDKSHFYRSVVRFTGERIGDQH
jgi:AraC-like DNA-binding protein